MPRRKDPIHGFIYQLKLLMLFLHRGIRRKYDFILRTEMEEAGSFDDLFFEYIKDKEKYFRLLQAKHSLDESKKITAMDLLAGMKKDQKYSLIKYYYSYMTCKNQKLFKKGSFKDLIICTNIDFDIDDLKRNGIDVHPVTEEDDILSINISGGQKKPMRYTFDKNFVNILKPELEKNYDSSVVKDLVNFILANKPLHKTHFGDYVNALTYEIIDKKNKELSENFVSNENLSPRASEFRDMFEYEIKKQSKKQLDLNTLNEAIRNKTPINGKIPKLNIPQGFGQNPDKKKIYWPAKDIKTENVLEFLNLLIVAVNQINEDELGEAIKHEIGDQFNKITTKSIYTNLFQYMVDFLQDKKPKGKAKLKFWTFKEGENFIENICFEIIHLQLSGYRDYLDSIKFYFKETLFEKPQHFINSEEPLWLLTSETPWLSTLAIYQCIKKSKQSMNLFTYKWDDLLENSGRILLDFNNLNHFLIIVTCLQMTGTEDITAELVDKIEQLFFNQNNTAKKIIVVASKHHELRRQLLIKHQSCLSQELDIGLIDMDELSQKTLMEKENIYFGGSNRLSLQKLLNINDQDSQEKVQLLNLDAAAIELLLRNPELKVFDQTNDFNSLTYKPNKLVTFNSVIKEISSNNYDIFAFYGDDEEMKTLFRDKNIELVTFGATDSLKLIMRHRFILLELEKEETEFNHLCKILHDYTYVISDNNKPALHKLKYVDKDNWIWMQTFDYNFYINRHYERNIFSKRFFNLLSEENSQDFIIFSGLLENEVLRETCNYYNSSNIEFNSCTFANNCGIAKLRKTAKRKFNFLSKIVEENLSYHPSDTYLTVTRFYNKKAIHWIKLQNVLDYENKQKLRLEWQQSIGNVIAVRRRYNIDDDFLSEDNLIHFNQRLILIADGPGTGKSINLTRIVRSIKKYKPTSLIIEIDLNKLQRSSVSFCVESKEQLINFLFRVLKKSSVHAVEKKIVEYKINNSEQLILLFDGFDEVTKEQQENVIKLFKFIIQETKSNLWITSRPENKEKLETSLCVLSYSFNRLSRSDRINYLSHFWRVCITFCDSNSIEFNFKRFAEIVNQHFSSISETFNFPSLIKIPLMLRSVAVTYLNFFTRVLINNTENGSAIERKIREIKYTDIFESFVRHVYDIYFFEKIKMLDYFDKESQAILRDAYSNAYRCLAVKHVCLHNSMLYLEHKKEKITLITLSRIGLIQISAPQDINTSTEVYISNSLTCGEEMYDFIHPSFAECFASEFICIELKANPTSIRLWEFLIEIIIYRPFSRRVFEDKLEKDTQLSRLSSHKLQRNIIFNLLNAQVTKHGIAETLWRAASSKLRRTVAFLTKWYIDINFYNPLNFSYHMAAKRILNVNILQSFSKESDLVNYIMDHNGARRININTYNVSIVRSGRPDTMEYLRDGRIIFEIDILKENTNRSF